MQNWIGKLAARLSLRRAEFASDFGHTSARVSTQPRAFEAVWLALLLCGCLLCAACSSSDATSNKTTRYDFKGVVKSVNQLQHEATINHEKVGDFMEPMTMPFLIKDEAAFKQIQPGDQIKATLVVTEEGAQWLEQVVIQPKAQAWLEGANAQLLLAFVVSTQKGGWR